MTKSEDRALGMNRRITRRDFLDGLALTVGAAMARGQSGPNSTGAYPPALTGLRGNHPGSFEVAHAVRDNTFWKTAPMPQDTGEVYDLVVVGGGISGLAAAYFFRKHDPHARVLILDNHDDFGGHAKRNEFHAGGRLLISYGGTQSIDEPSGYSAVAKGLLNDLKIEPKRFFEAYDRGLFDRLGLGTGAFFDRSVFGRDRLVAGMGKISWPEFFARAPLSKAGREDLIRLYTAKIDYLPDLSREKKLELLGRISYQEFLTTHAKAGTEASRFLYTSTSDLWGVGSDAIAALSAARGGEGDYGISLFPGFQGMDLTSNRRPREDRDPYIFHFPDGNASIARALVRDLIPGSVPGSSMEDLVTARTDYTRLDGASSPVRLRLNSTAVRVRHEGPTESADTVEVAYSSPERDVKTVRGKACILACYNGMIPYLCDEIGEPQKQALLYGTKTPFVYTHVAIRNWTSFQKLKVHQIYCPSAYFSYIALDFPVSLGDYRYPSKPQEPMVLFLLRTPCSPGKPRKDQLRLGRAELLATPFSLFERNIRRQLQAALGPGGFNAARDIAAITVNRWAHGYAYEYNSLSDPRWAPNERPCVVGRQPFGRISIANSDAAARAYTDAAIDQAYRAVQERIARTKATA
jgi:spermidine dehydrogenase